MEKIKNTKPKRLLSLFLTLALLLSMLPAAGLTALAYSGNGTEENQEKTYELTKQ